MAQRGVELSVISPQPYAPPVGPYSEYGQIDHKIEFEEYTLHCPRFVYLLPKRLFYSLSGGSMRLFINRYLRTTFSPPDILHACHIYPDGEAIRSYAQCHDLPYTVVAHGGKLNAYDSYSPRVQRKIDRILADAALLICVSEALAEKATQLVPAVTTSVIPIGADVDRFASVDRARTRADLNLDESTQLILYVGQFIERKGIDVVIEALDELETDQRQYVFVGHRGDLYAELVEAVTEHGLDDSVTVRYQVSDQTLTELFVAADLLILPSRAEGRPTVIYEAMASKTAVLATSLLGIEEQVSDGETGVLYPSPPDPTFISRMNELTEQPELLQQMGEKGLQRLRQNQWTWDAHTDQIINAHEQLIEQ